VVQHRQAGRETDPDADFETATRHYMAGRHSRALALLHRNLEAYPEHSSTLHLLGVGAYQKGDYENARILIGRALSIDPQKPHYYHNFGKVCAALGESQDAINAYRQAINLKPDYIEAYCSLGRALQDQLRFDEALDLFDKILQISPYEANIHHGRGKILSAQGRYDQAIEAFARAIDLNPDKAIFYNSLGIARGLSGDQPAAIEAFELALNIQPDLAEAVNNLGTAMQELGEFDKALEYFGRAIQIRPDYGEACFNRAAICLLKGDFEQGWADYEGRSRQTGWKRSHTCPPGMPRWNGNFFTGKRLCVHSEQGLGDTLQFIRYLPLVKALGGTVVLETSELLVELLSGLKSVDEFVIQGSDYSKDADHDMCVHLLSLPGLFQTTLETIPSTVPYVVADSVKVSYWKHKLTGHDFKIGLVWAGNPSHKKDSSRSVELEHFGVLDKISGLRMYGLQKGEAARQAGKLADVRDIHNFGDELYDFSDTAALIANLDLVVSVDTAVAHLAGSMGKPIWVMLPYVPDWRWMLARDDSPWYPTMRLFRQPEKGNWDAVMRNIVKELEIQVSST
jgi:tetratricopeptide (TPR) repeat protein